MGSRNRVKQPKPPKVQAAPVLPTPTDMTNIEGYQQKATADDMTMQSTILTKPKRKKKTGEMQDSATGSTLMGSY